MRRHKTGPVSASTGKMRPNKYNDKDFFVVVLFCFVVVVLCWCFFFFLLLLFCVALGQGVFEFTFISNCCFAFWAEDATFL